MDGKNELFKSDPLDFVKKFPVNVLNTTLSSRDKAKISEIDKSGSLIKEFTKLFGYTVVNDNIVQRSLEKGRFDLELNPQMAGSYFLRYVFGGSVTESDDKSYEFPIEGYWLPYLYPSVQKSGLERIPFIDLPKVNPDYNFMFTGGMNGCSLVIVAPKDNPGYIRVYHDSKHEKKTFEDLSVLLRLDYDRGVSGSNYIYGTDSYDGKTFYTSFNFLHHKNHRWHLVSQSQIGIDIKGNVKLNPDLPAFEVPIPDLDLKVEEGMVLPKMLSLSESIENKATLFSNQVLLNGMRIVFDQSASAYSVQLELNKRKLFDHPIAESFGGEELSSNITEESIVATVVALQTISQDERFKHTQEMLNKEIPARIWDALRQSKTYVKFIPVFGIAQVAREARQAEHNKKRSKNLVDTARSEGISLLELIAVYLNNHYGGKRNSRIVSGTVSVAMLPVGFLLPGAGEGVGKAIGVTTEIGEKVLVDQGVSTAVSSASKKFLEKTGVNAAATFEKWRRKDKAVITAKEISFKNEVVAIRALILYLGLPRDASAKGESENFETARLFLKEQLGSDPNENLFEGISTEEDEELYKNLKERATTGSWSSWFTEWYSKMRYHSLVNINGMNYLRMLWMMEGYLGRLSHDGEAKKTLRIEGKATTATTKAKVVSPISDS